MPTRAPSVDRVNADTSGGGRAVAGVVLGGTAGDGWGRAAAYDAYADGLHTYALWYLRDHDAAADAVYCAFVAADRNHTNLRAPEQIQPWLYALLRRECRVRAAEPDAPTPVSARLRPKPDSLGESGVAASLMQLEGNLRRAEFQSLAWAEAESLAPAHREVLELTIRHGLDSRGLALVLGLRESAAGLAPSRGFGLLADAWRELERSLAAAAVAESGRENCAQLAELTFGWDGKMSAALRAPLTEHVDRCSRCQHYLHTVIGTPSAPTMLPFVAAPRALREILLGELADIDAASDAGVDLIALGTRCGSFGPDGFPARTDAVSQGSAGAAIGVRIGAGTGAGSGTGIGAGAGTGRLARRRLPGGPRAARGTRVVGPGPGSGSGSGSADVAGNGAEKTESVSATQASGLRASANPATVAAGGPTTKSVTAPGEEHRSAQYAAASQTAVPRADASQTAAPRPATPQTDDLFRARGSWADKVLPPQASAASAQPRGLGELWRPEPEPGFVQTPSGRFAIRSPEHQPPATAGASSGFNAADATANPVTDGDTRQPRYAKSGGRPVRGPSSAPARRAPAGRALAGSTSAASPKAASAAAASAATTAPATAFTSTTSTTTSTTSTSTRPRHKARPMRQAVVSAMALGAIGAVAAAAAAMLGAAPHPHANSTIALDDPPGGGEPLGAATGSTAHTGGLTVSVTTGSRASGASTADGAAGQSTAAVSSSPTTASAGAFYVSANQRAADPDSVQILLRNAGNAPLHWSAAPSVPWLTLSQGSGTLAAGQRMQVTATAGASAPSGLWSAQIVFSPGGIVVTVHGGIPSGGGPSSPTSPGTGTGTPTGGTSPSSPSSPSAPSSPSSPSTNPTGGTSQSPAPTGPTGGSTPTGTTPTASTPTASDASSTGSTPTATATATGATSTPSQGSTTPVGGTPPGRGAARPA